MPETWKVVGNIIPVLDINHSQSINWNTGKVVSGFSCVVHRKMCNTTLMSNKPSKVRQGLITPINRCRLLVINMSQFSHVTSYAMFMNLLQVIKQYILPSFIPKACTRLADVSIPVSHHYLESWLMHDTIALKAVFQKSTFNLRDNSQDINGIMHKCLQSCVANYVPLFSHGSTNTITFIDTGTNVWPHLSKRNSIPILWATGGVIWWVLYKKTPKQYITFYLCLAKPRYARLIVILCYAVLIFFSYRTHQITPPVI